MASSIEAILVIDPVTEWREVVKEALNLNYHVITLQLSATTPQFAKFLPTSEQLKDAGVTHTLIMEIVICLILYDKFKSWQCIVISRLLESYHCQRLQLRFQIH
jgi:hypothetical protein